MVDGGLRSLQNVRLAVECEVHVGRSRGMLGQVVELLVSRCCACFVNDSVCSAVNDDGGNSIFPSGVILLYSEKGMMIGLDPAAWERL